MAYLSGWGADQRIKLEIDKTKVDGVLTGFPVPVKLSTSSGIGGVDVSEIFDELGANRLKIAVTEDDEVTECKVEIEHWDNGNELAVLYVKVPTVASGDDTTLYLYYDKNHADNTTNVGDIGDVPARAVWDSDFEAVYHMNQDPSGGAGCMLDSTDNGLDGTPEGTMLTGDLVAFGLGKGLDLDGTDDQIATPLPAGYPGEEITVEAHFHSDAAANNCLATQDDAQGSGSDLFNLMIDGFSKLVFGLRTDALGWEAPETAFSDTSNPHYAAGKKASGSNKSKLWLDDGTTTVESDNAFEMRTPATTAAYIGVQTGNKTRDFDGRIGEVRVSKIARADAWLKATYHGLFDSLITFTTDDAAPPVVSRKLALLARTGLVDNIRWGEKPSEKPSRLAIGRDYGRRVYMDSPDYMTAMKRRTDKQLDNTRDRIHSDDKKPYLNDEFPEMEYFHTPYTPPPWTPVVPPTVPPVVPPPPPNPPEIPPEDGTSLTVFWVGGFTCYERGWGEITEMELTSSYPVIGYEFWPSGGIWVPDQVVISIGGAYPNQILAVAAGKKASTAFRIVVSMRGYNPDGVLVHGTYGPTLLNSCN